MPSITLVHQAALGDTLLLAPLIHSLRHRFRPASISLVSQPSFGTLLTHLRLIDNHFSANDHDHTLWFAPPTAPHPNSHPAWADADLLLSAVAQPTDPWAANARLARPRHDPASLLFFRPRPPTDFPDHVTAWHRLQLAPLHLTPAPLPPPRLNPHGPILIHPGAGTPAKCWPLTRFLTLARHLQTRHLTPTFLLGEVELDRWPPTTIQTLQSEFPTHISPDLRTLADLLATARLFLGNDSAISHLAATLALPTLALFGPSNPTHWSPLGPAVQIFRPPAPTPSDLQTLDESTVLHTLLNQLHQ